MNNYNKTSKQKQTITQEWQSLIVIKESTQMQIPQILWDFWMMINLMLNILISLPISMGNYFDCKDKDPQAQQILFTLSFANRNAWNNHKYESLLTLDRSRFYDLIKNAKYVKETLGNTIVEVASCPMGPSPKQGEALFPQKPVKLVLRSVIDQQDSGITKKTQSSKFGPSSIEGCIIFHKAYYYGNLMGTNAHGVGTLYYECLQFYEISGIWHNDNFTKGEVYKLKNTERGPERSKVLNLKLIDGEKEAIVEVPDQFQYHGSIKLDGATKISEILTGTGQIRYLNGDIYIGSLSKSLYEGPGKIIFANGEIRVFQGHFKAGKRHGRGIISTYVEGEECNISANFQNGLPVGNGLINIPFWQLSYPFEFQNSNFFIENRISELLQ